MSIKKYFQKVDIIIFNTQIYTLNKKFDIAEAMAIKNNIIVGIGSNETIFKAFSSKKKLDLLGKFIYPGFFDAHCHFIRYALLQQAVQLHNCTSLVQMLEQVKQYHHQHPTQQFIIGQGWDETKWKDKQLPTKTQLDQFFPNIPILLIRIDLHAALANQKALDMAGITPQTTIEGGIIEQKNGKLTGILIDKAISLVKQILPKATQYTIKQALLQAQKNCFAVGLTTLSDALLEPSEIEIIDQLQQEKKLLIRIYGMINATEENRKYLLKKGKIKTNHLTVRTFKYFADGALGSKGAWLLQPYEKEKKNKGLALLEEKKFIDELQWYKQHGFQVATHAIGDAANRFVLDCYSFVLQTSNNLRWRLEHAQIVHPDDIYKFKEYSIFPSIQATHATSDMLWIQDRIGKERTKTAYAFQELLQQYGMIAAGSDFPVEPINPLLGFYAAVARKNKAGFPPTGFQMKNALTREQALKAMTIWAAYSNFEEKEKGSLEVGKLADFVVLDKDIMSIPIDEVLTTKVVQTFIGGELVYAHNMVKKQG